MHDNRSIHLTDRTVLRLSGTDTITFLQGLLTRDMRALSPTRPLYALMLTPQGKFLYDLFIIQQGEYLWLDIAANTKDALLKKLMMYKLRSDVQIEDSSATHSVLALPDGTSPALPISYIDPRGSALGARAIISTSTSPEGFTEAPKTVYSELRIRAGVPDAADMADGFPLQFRMDELRAIDFDKGCYVGQEVTTRSKHRGNIRKSVFVVEATTTLPEAGSVVTSGDKKAGVMLSSAEQVGLALLEKEMVSEPLQAGDTALKVILPR